MMILQRSSVKLGHTYHEYSVSDESGLRQTAGVRRIGHPLTLRKVALVAVISSVIVSSAILVDVSLGGYDYKLEEPSVSDDFPETLYFYNISEGVTFNTFSLIFVLPANHSGHNHIIPRGLSLIFWFNASDNSADLSSFIMVIRRTGLWNCTLSMNNYMPYYINKTRGDWWTPYHTWFVFNENPDIDSVRFGIAFELVLVNSFGDSFDGHELNVQLEMNVTYSRWWFAQRISESHQVARYTFSLPDSGTAVVQSLEY